MSTNKEMPEEGSDDPKTEAQLKKMLEHVEAAERFALLDLENLKYELMHAEEEVKRVQSVPRVVGQFLEAVDQNHAIVQSTTGRRSCGLVGYPQSSF